ncbi:ABC transporter ATP-binding protein [Haliscomenobacter hydrossis]|uniref:Xenobiotic-transporting ATPase n=1 Tax=Haliscomenobacter hydrossis (strain ATCC 27775 / DSM 1100 / LMG 10767 / O) TaxID=760192 RepID=F4KYZ0_HALH1|nr:ABC transporter ATP-binding protein [Haliscomenobacter hydrossis]AEE52677.1 Xenobiotic-transporting ATPase [Haliscomenobacter hydrossis DSM 1100]
MDVIASKPANPPRFTSLTRLVIDLVLPYRHWLLIVFTAMLIETAMSLAAPWPLKIIIDQVINNQELPHGLSWLNNWLPGEQAMELAAVCGFALVFFTIIGGLAGYVNNYFTESVAQYLANDLRIKTYGHLQQLSLAYYDTHKVGELLSTITTDVNTIQDYVATNLLRMLVDVLTITGIFGLMLYLRWDFALISVGMAPFLLLFVIRFKRAVKKATHEVRKDQAELITIMQHGLESIRAVSVFGRQELEEDRLEKVSLDTVHAALKARRIKSFISPIFAIGVSVCTAIVLWRGTQLVIAEIMSIGALTVFLSYMSKFFSPVIDLGKMTVSIAQATVALERIQRILSANMIIPQKADAIDPGNLAGNIVFDHVSFAYQPDVPILQDINLTIRAGQRIGICGPTGSGKSTLASLIPRLYDPTSGRILIDGQDISDYTLAGLRREIGFVLQDTMLFYGTIRNNIAYGRPDATEEEIAEAARLANADEFISKLPMRYETIVGERGVTLSGGERQRIGIARAIVRNAPILILDEPTASLDAEAEKIVSDALAKLMKGRTVITISHRLNTLLAADKILVINEGIIAEEGTHQTLLEKGGIYAELYRVFDAQKTLPYKNRC